jgi:hypothetical protein
MNPKHITKLTFGALAVLSALLLSAMPALAHRPGKGPHKHPHPSDKPGPELTKDEVKDRLQKVRDHHKEHRQDVAKHRKERRDDARKALRTAFKNHPKIGPKLRGQIRGEFEVHGRRMARLKRIQAVAAEKENFDAVEKIDVLIAREQARHKNWVDNAKDLKDE